VCRQLRLCFGWDANHRQSRHQIKANVGAFYRTRKTHIFRQLRFVTEVRLRNSNRLHLNGITCECALKQNLLTEKLV
jgi:hypothetical protein